MKRWIHKGAAALIALVMLLGGAMPAAAEEEVQWVDGEGQQVQLDTGIASFKLDEGLIFLDGNNTRTWKKQIQSVPSGEEIGTVIPDEEDSTWIAIFEYTDSGYIEDSEKDKIDADALLDSYKEGTAEDNKEKDPSMHLFVDDWDVKPTYDADTNRLVWSLLAHNARNEKIINYNMRVLTRTGYISIILVSDPEHLQADRKELEKRVLSTFQVTAGKRYEDFDSSTDKKAEYGLTGLVLGGAGLAVAKKLGFLAVLKKFWIVIVAAIVGVWRLITGKKKKQEEPAEAQNEMQSETVRDNNTPPPPAT
ncbi:DUF2167 domain-containing protein [Paenibacillus thiaminolyticus]|uniref:DUF2167 domain-containing protein n=1 Tax=Paenibacillus thiaminolyticus TaxID=49283 RepID=UPI0035A662D5